MNWKVSQKKNKETQREKVSPEQVTPVPLNPELQAHVKDPGVLVQVA